jgi:hypothetical protein
MEHRIINKFIEITPYFYKKEILSFYTITDKKWDNVKMECNSTGLPTQNDYQCIKKIRGIMINHFSNSVIARRDVVGAWVFITVLA